MSQIHNNNQEEIIDDDIEYITYEEENKPPRKRTLWKRKVVYLTFGITYVILHAILLFVYPKLYGEKSNYKLWIIISNLLYFLIIYNFARCHMTSSKDIPKKYYAIDTTEKREYCQQCQLYKGERTHHCREMNQCYPRYNHYCSVLSNSLAIHNTRYFFLFILYVFIAVVIVFIQMIRMVLLESCVIPYPLLVALCLLFGNFVFLLSVLLIF